jgi:hypothetical protein
MGPGMAQRRKAATGITAENAEIYEGLCVFKAKAPGIYAFSAVSESLQFKLCVQKAATKSTKQQFLSDIAADRSQGDSCLSLQFFRCYAWQLLLHPD